MCVEGRGAVMPVIDLLLLSMMEQHCDPFTNSHILWEPAFLSSDLNVCLRV